MGDVFGKVCIAYLSIVVFEEDRSPLNGWHWVNQFRELLVQLL
jgi:hypothetical protein